MPKRVYTVVTRDTREHLVDKVTSEKRSKRGKEISHVEIWVDVLLQAEGMDSAKSPCLSQSGTVREQ